MINVGKVLDLEHITLMREQQRMGLLTFIYIDSLIVLAKKMVLPPYDGEVIRVGAMSSMVVVSTNG